MNVPRTTVRLLTALLKHQARVWLGDEAAGILSDTFIDEEVRRRLDAWVQSEETQKRLLAAAEQARAWLQDPANCPDPALRKLFHSLDFGTLPSVQEELADLPTALDLRGLETALRRAFDRDLPHMDAAKRAEAARLYAEALEVAVGQLKEFTGRIVLNMLQEIRRQQNELRRDLNYLTRPLVYLPLLTDSYFKAGDKKALLRLVKGDIPRWVVITGPTGSGKTQLALEFAWEYKENFKGVYWFEAGDMKNSAHLQIFQSKAEGALCIIDDVENPRELNYIMRRYIFPSLRSHIIVTSCYHSWPQYYDNLLLFELPYRIYSASRVDDHWMKLNAELKDDDAKLTVTRVAKILALFGPKVNVSVSLLNVLFPGSKDTIWDSLAYLMNYGFIYFDGRSSKMDSTICSYIVENWLDPHEIVIYSKVIRCVLQENDVDSKIRINVERRLNDITRFWQGHTTTH